jgi:quinohemoprotein ethanol dehydrogenase
MSYNPGTGLVYIPTIHVATTFSDAGVDVAHWQVRDWKAETPKEGVGVSGVVWTLFSARNDGVDGTLQAWDPVRQRRVWEVVFRYSRQP